MDSEYDCFQLHLLLLERTLNASFLQINLLFFYTVETLKKIDIPSVFIGESSANSLKDEFTYEKG